MVIKRTVNGVDMEFELTPAEVDEAADIAKLTDRIVKIDDLRQLIQNLQPGERLEVVFND